MSERVAVGADHAGYPLKVEVVDWLNKNGFAVVDLGTNSADPVDYPDYAFAVGEAVTSGKADVGIIICGSGVGACVAANKVPGIRAGLCHDTFSARQGREDDDTNVLCMGARVIGQNLAYEVLKSFLNARFSGLERHQRRLNKVLAMEEKYTGQKC
ncbi:MAG: ribose 5-phosphate isomerase B [Candidatus Obscuribacterales bacterium]|nr:ribose 5-phosphate isomerase B [Candidatus Obscuribacterales bacterium]